MEQLSAARTEQSNSHVPLSLEASLLLACTARPDGSREGHRAAREALSLQLRPDASDRLPDRLIAAWRVQLRLTLLIVHLVQI